MYASIGVLLSLAGLLMLKFAIIHHRRPRPSAWTEGDFTTQFYVCANLSLLAAGGAFIALYFVAGDEQSLGVAGLLAIAAGVVVAWLLNAAMGRQWQRFLAEDASADGATVLPFGVSGGGPGQPPASGAGKGRGRKAA
jgi:hypothetical protein